MTINIPDAYRPRPVRFLELWEHDGWRVKVYGISAAGGHPSPELVEATKREAARVLPSPAVTDERYGVAFLYAHETRGGGAASVNWWGNENELFHHQFESAAGDLSSLLPVEQTGGSSACVWDLAVIAHEREAWVDAVLAKPEGPDLDDYIARVLEADL